MIKKAAFVIALGVFLTFVHSEQTSKDVPLDNIDSQIKTTMADCQMNKCSDRDLAHFIGLNHNSFEGYIYYKSGEALGVDEVLILKSPDKKTLNEARDAIDKRIQTQKSTFEGYGPKQVAELKNALVIQKGNYLLYSVGEKNNEKIEEVYKNVI